MMHHTSRFQRQCEQIDSFIESDKTEMFYFLYSNEIRRLKKNYPDLSIEKTEISQSTQTGTRHQVRISKLNS